MGPGAGGIAFRKVSMGDFAGRFLSSIPMIGRPVLGEFCKLHEFSML
jgi:hypothetical protein